MKKILLIPYFCFCLLVELTCIIILFIVDRFSKRVGTIVFKKMMGMLDLLREPLDYA